MNEGGWRLRGLLTTVGAALAAISSGAIVIATEVAPTSKGRKGTHTAPLRGGGAVMGANNDELGGRIHRLGGVVGAALAAISSGEIVIATEVAPTSKARKGPTQSCAPAGARFPAKA